jgi:transcriptional regulator with XRE-family HTH domain
MNNTPVDTVLNSEADRVGQRIRQIRESKKMSQTELGERVGLTADRIQKYENGVRKPKSKLLKEIAAALNVEVLALCDPITSNYLGAMYAFFEMEKLYGLRVKRVDGKLVLVFGDGIIGDFNDYLNEWEKECRQVDAELNLSSSEEERLEILRRYDQWKWTFPWSITETTKKSLLELRKERIKKQIDQLQRELIYLSKE